MSFIDGHPHADRAFPAPSAAKPTVLIVPGLGNSPDGHWQSAWERERSDCVRADLGDWDHPNPSHWVARLDAIIRAIPGPAVIAAHSLGCIATALWASTHASHHSVAGALLVAPCDAEAADAPAALRRFAPISRQRFPFSTAVAASTNDPYAGLARAREIAAWWGSKFVNIGAAGHINAQSNLGAWRQGQDLLDAILQPQIGVTS